MGLALLAKMEDDAIVSLVVSFRRGRNPSAFFEALENGVGLTLADMPKFVQVGLKMPVKVIPMHRPDAKEAQDHELGRKLAGNS